MQKDMERVKSEKERTQDRLDALQKDYEANKKHQQHRIDELLKKLDEAREKADKASMMAAADEVQRPLNVPYINNSIFSAASTAKTFFPPMPPTAMSASVLFDRRVKFVRTRRTCPPL